MKGICKMFLNKYLFSVFVNKQAVASHKILLTSNSDCTLEPKVAVDVY